MDYFFSPTSNVPRFQNFDAPHLTALGLLVLVNILIVWWGRRHTAQRPLLRSILLAVVVGDVISWQLWNYAYGMWDIRWMLPLHMCGLMLWVSGVLLVNKNPRLYEFVYFLGLGGAVQALLTPDSGGLGFPHFRAFEIIISHGLIVTTAIYFTLVEGYRPTWDSVKRVVVGTQLYVLFIFVFDQLVGANYMFLARKPDVPSLIDLLGPWPLYIISLEVIAFVLVGVLYLPWAIKDRQTRRVASVTP